MKQETLEEAAENFWLNYDSMTDNDRISYVNGFLACAKWNQERSYSEEEVEEIVAKLMHEVHNGDITYGDYENNDGVNFSTSREITVSEKNKLDVHLNFKQYQFDKELTIVFNIPANYTRK